MASPERRAYWRNFRDSNPEAFRNACRKGGKKSAEARRAKALEKEIWETERQRNLLAGALAMARATVTECD